jgi:hypothetical protein
MATEKQLTILINAKDNASRELQKVGGAFNTLKNTTISLSSVMKTTAFALGAVGGGMAYALKMTTDASNELNNSLIGLNSVAAAFKQDTTAAKQAAIDLAKDGLMSVKDAAAGLKNLLATGFSLPEAINLMNAFKDSAAFNRQGTLEFGQAIEGATQGIKNQNSILVDNAGITKNLSIILKEAGYSQQDLMNVTSDASVRQALYNGLIKEASIFQGDAAKMSGTLAGQQAALGTQIFMVKAAIGDALAPVMSAIVTKIMEMIQSVGGPQGITAKMMQYQDTIMSIVELMFALVQVIVFAIDCWLKFVNVLSTVINKAEAAYSAITKLAGALGGNAITAWKNLPANLGFGGGKAVGGPVSAGTSYLVGEKGPELFVPSTSGSIVPNGAGQIVINISGNNINGTGGIKELTDTIARQLVNTLGLNKQLVY